MVLPVKEDGPADDFINRRQQDRPDVTILFDLYVARADLYFAKF